MDSPATRPSAPNISTANHTGIERRRLVLLLRSVVIATTGYLVLSGAGGLHAGHLLYVSVFAASNVALAMAPRAWFYTAHFGPLLLLADTAFILFGLSWSQSLSQDLILVYFFTVFLITIGDSLGQIAIGSALIAAVYGYWLWASGSAPLVSGAWVRLPFFFMIGIFYASLIEQLKHEKHRRRAAEDESRHLHLLHELASVFSETHTTREFVSGIGRFLEATCPSLLCSLVLRGEEAATLEGETFPLRAHGHEYGTLCVGTVAPGGLSGRERWLCQMVAHAAAGALYAAEQSDAARVAVEAREQFLATVSHEFRTPLHAILGYLDMLDATIKTSEDGMVRESVGRMRVNACRLQNLLEELVSFTEIRSGRRALRPEVVSLRAVTEDLIPITRELVEGKPVAVSYRVDADADELITDRRKLLRVMSCLLSNSAKFTEDGRIDVTVKQAGDDAVEVVIADTGIGISAADLAVIFDDFRQADGSFTRRYGGLGIGLTLARELIRLLGGTIDLRSQVGRGTSVRVRLPKQCGGAPAATQVTLPAAAGGGTADQQEVLAPYRRAAVS